MQAIVESRTTGRVFQATHVSSLTLNSFCLIVTNRENDAMFCAFRKLILLKKEKRVLLCFHRLLFCLRTIVIISNQSQSVGLSVDPATVLGVSYPILEDSATSCDELVHS
jgi:hypothetical protein